MRCKGTATPMNDKVIFSIHPEHTKNIFDLIKQLEIRKKVPKCDFPYIGFIYETKKNGGAGAVIGFFTCKCHIKTNVFAIHSQAGDAYRKDIAKRACLTEDKLYTYANGESIYGIDISTPVLFPRPRPLSDFGIKRAPQSWQYIK